MTENMKHPINCTTCQGTGRCTTCDGEGVVEHKCRTYTLAVKHTGPGRCERTTYECCRFCGKLEKVRYQYDPGTGSDHIFLSVGQTERYLTFTVREAVSVLRKHRPLAVRILGRDNEWRK